jgi:hypothetical protein
VNVHWTLRAFPRESRADRAVSIRGSGCPSRLLDSRKLPGILAEVSESRRRRCGSPRIARRVSDSASRARARSSYGSLDAHIRRSNAQIERDATRLSPANSVSLDRTRIRQARASRAREFAAVSAMAYSRRVVSGPTSLVRGRGISSPAPGESLDKTRGNSDEGTRSMTDDVRTRRCPPMS